MSNLAIVDIIPFDDSTESGQNSEPSLAVNPLNPNQVIVGSYSSDFNADGGVVTPYFETTDGGVTWTGYGDLSTLRKSMAWSQDGSTALTATLSFDNTTGTEIKTFSGTTADSDFGSAISTYDTGAFLDQPWIRTGPSGHVYIAYDDLGAAASGLGGASVLVSTDGGTTYTPVAVDRVGTPLQDASPVRLAINGSTVYSAFTRWNSVADTNSSGETRYNAQVVVVRSDDGGADGFDALGAVAAQVRTSSAFEAEKTP